MTTSNRVEFTTEMKRDYTILVPNMAPIHFGLLRNVFINYGYRMEILQNDAINIKINLEGIPKGINPGA